MSTVPFASQATFVRYVFVVDRRFLVCFAFSEWRVLARFDSFNVNLSPRWVDLPIVVCGSQEVGSVGSNCNFSLFGESVEEEECDGAFVFLFVHRTVMWVMFTIIVSAVQDVGRLINVISLFPCAFYDREGLFRVPVCRVEDQWRVVNVQAPSVYQLVAQAVCVSAPVERLPNLQVNGVRTQEEGEVGRSVVDLGWFKGLLSYLFNRVHVCRTVLYQRSRAGNWRCGGRCLVSRGSVFFSILALACRLVVLWGDLF